MKYFTRIIFFIPVILISGCFETAEEYYKAGTEKVKTKNYKEALEDFDNAIDKNSRYGAAYLERGKLKYILKANKEAETDFDKALKYDPSLSEDALIGKSRIKMESNDYAAAINLLTIAEEINPASKQVYYLRIDAKKKLNDLPGVIIDYTNIIALDSLNAEAFLLRGEHYILINDKSSACKDFKIAKKLNSSAELNERINNHLKSNCGK